MGQRFQSVFILPPIDMGTIDFNETENPNNRREKVLIFYNQWLYGKGALFVNLQIIERLKKAMKERKKCGSYALTKQGFINHFLERSLKNAISWASMQELHRETKFSHPQSFIYDDENKKENPTLSGELLRQDNNNGFFICSIDDKLNIKYGFISGLEDTEIYEYKTPGEYLKLFYQDDKTFKEMKKIFLGFDKFDKIDLNKVVEEMNESLKK